MPSPPEIVTALVVGLGNIGSHLVPHVARMPEIDRVVLVDPDVYGESNRRSQAIGSADIGRAKTAVQADVVRQINPQLVVAECSQTVEEVPLGCLRGTVILACVDSREARQYLNEVARTLGMPWVDAGVEPGSWLARVNVYEPGGDAPCLECAWDQPDYDALLQRYPCESGADSPATGGSSSLGALAAALQAVECEKLLAGRRAEAAVGAQVLIDASSHTLYRTMMRRNPTCRLPHAGPLEITGLASSVHELTLADVLAMGSGEQGDVSSSRLSVPMHAWAGRLVCGRCGHEAAGPVLHRSSRGSVTPCPDCDGTLTVSGFDVREGLGSETVTTTGLSDTLADLGLRDGDVVGIERSGAWRYVALGMRSMGGTGDDDDEGPNL